MLKLIQKSMRLKLKPMFMYDHRNDMIFLCQFPNYYRVAILRYSNFVSLFQFKASRMHTDTGIDARSFMINDNVVTVVQRTQRM